ncbi:MAG: AbrB/MazE/SpoVT family DNA-binding domain-containing protein [Candidatus Obscuribacterales bacterium]|nr:AbrB/MazE/SpoVT family DNA-binding domain-containing protein [Candidatus Obscuribacterales bacterium]
MYASRLTEKYQATIPAEIRKRLGLKRGDLIGFSEVKGQVILVKATPLDLTYAKAVETTLAEWNSAADEKAYGNL